MGQGEEDIPGKRMNQGEDRLDGWARERRMGQNEGRQGR